MLSDDWWATADSLVEVAEDATGVELPPRAGSSLVEMVVEPMVLLIRWPCWPLPANPLGYLRARRARMESHAPWLYALPQDLRRLLIGTGHFPSLLTFVVGRRNGDEACRRAWREALVTLGRQAEPAEGLGPDARPVPPERARPAAPDGKATATACTLAPRRRQSRLLEVRPPGSDPRGGTKMERGTTAVRARAAVTHALAQPSKAYSWGAPGPRRSTAQGSPWLRGPPMGRSSSVPPEPPPKGARSGPPRRRLGASCSRVADRPTRVWPPKPRGHLLGQGLVLSALGPQEGVVIH